MTAGASYDLHNRPSGVATTSMLYGFNVTVSWLWWKIVFFFRLSLPVPLDLLLFYFMIVFFTSTSPSCVILFWLFGWFTAYKRCGYNQHVVWIYRHRFLVVMKNRFLFPLVHTCSFGSSSSSSSFFYFVVDVLWVGLFWLFGWFTAYPPSDVVTTNILYVWSYRHRLLAVMKERLFSRLSIPLALDRLLL